MPLLDYDVRFYCDDVSPYLQCSYTQTSTNPAQTNVVNIEKLSFTNARIGGCQGCEITLVCESASYINASDLWGYLVPNSTVCIQIKATGDSALKRRYHGIIESVTMGEGTDPHRRVVRCHGGLKLLDQTCEMLYLDAVTPHEAMDAIAAKVSTSHTNAFIASDADLITYDPTYTIAQADFVDISLARMLEIVNEVGGADAIYGVAPSTGVPVSMFQGYIYFAQMSGTALDLGFEVGSSMTVESATRTLSCADEINAALVTCQRKIGGGNLYLYVAADVTGRPWKWAKLQLPEIVDAADAYRYGSIYCDAREGNTETITFEVPGYGKQVWTNEIMCAPLKVALTEGGADYSVWPDSYTLTFTGSGEVSTKFVLGKRPDPTVSIGKDWATTLRDIVVAKSQELWSGAELTAANKDIIREWRRTAGKDHNIRNFWAASLDSIDSVVKLDEVGTVAVVPPSAWPDAWDYEYNAERQVIDNAGNPEWLVLSCFIPTGLTAQSAVVFVDNIGSIIPYDSRYIIDHEWVFPTSSGTFGYGFANDSTYGRALYYLTGGTMLGYDCMSYVTYEFNADVDESPFTIKVGRPRVSDNATAPTNFTDMAALTGYVDLMFAMNGNSSSDADYYCVRLFRTSATDSLVYATAGWVEGGVSATLTGDHWTTASSPYDTFSVGTDDGDGWNSTHPYLRVVVTMPVADDDEWSVVIYDGDSDTVLWSFAEDVDIGSGEAWSPVGKMIAGMRWVDYNLGTGYFVHHGIKEIAFSGSDALPIAITRNGTTWNTSTAGTLKTLTGDNAWADDSVGIRIAVKGGVNDEMGAWGMGFLLTDET
jgi:hypothetical protein